ncbi:MAG: type II toxin-antitoxin system VapC family toxin [Anaerolineaceae bacterium]|nr:type II toxin-antitoxin system VapC family toxin [Anaerolineaceae bacterium]
MNVVVDSSGWLEYFAKGANGARFAPAIQNSADLLVPTICLYEVFKRVALQRGEEEALQAAGLMMLARVIDITQEVALSAAQLSMEHKLPMADSLILAAARLYNDELWTQDAHFKGLDQVVFIER